MPKRNKIDKKTLEECKKNLLEIKEKILGNIQHLKDNTDALQKEGVSDSGHALHMADVATDMYDREFSLGLASKDRELLNKIDEALLRIEQGTYGICLGTGKPISKARLKAIPYAEYCLEYQEELEKTSVKEPQ